MTCVVRTAANRLLSELPTTPADDVDCISNHSSSTPGSREPSLPKLELPSFGGDVTKWRSFLDQFSAVIDGSELPQVSKFVYLLSLLTADAELSVKGLTISASHYEIAKHIQMDRYWRKERIISTHIQQLINITVPGNPTCVVAVARRTVGACSQLGGARCDGRLVQRHTDAIDTVSPPSRRPTRVGT